MIEYQDFSLRFHCTAEDCWEVRAEGPAGGHGVARFTLPEPVPLEGLLAPTLDCVGRPVRPPSSSGGGRQLSPHAMGQLLFERVFNGEVRDLFHASLAEARARGQGLRLRLELPLTSPGLSSLAVWPWELLYRPDLQLPLALDRQTPIVRALALPQPRGFLKLRGRLRVLLVAASPKDSPPLMLMEEGARIRQRLRTGRRVEIHALEPPTLEALRPAVHKHQPHVLHFMGHGDLSAGTRGGALVFEDPQGSSDPISWDALATELRALESLRLVVINACHSAETSRWKGADPHSGVAQALLQAGLPGVVAMQSLISDRAAVAFTGELYRHLAAGDPVEAAVTEGRLAMHRAERAEAQWAAPVLFLRAPDGELFRRDFLLRPRWVVAAVLLALVLLIFVVALTHHTPTPVGEIRVRFGSFNPRSGDSHDEGAWPQGLRETLLQGLVGLETEPPVALVENGPESVAALQDGDGTGYRILEGWVDGDRLRVRVIPEGVHPQTEAPTFVEITARGEAVSSAAWASLQEELVLALLLKLGTVPNLNSLEAMSRNNRGVAMLEQRKERAAEAAFIQALELDPEFAPALSNLGLLEAARGDYPRALKHLRAAVDKVPASAVFQFNLGAMLGRLDRGEEALEFLERAAELDPCYAQAFNELGIIYLRLGRSTDAELRLLRGIDCDSSIPALHKNLGRVQLELGEPNRAVGSFETAISLCGPGDRLVDLEATLGLARAQAMAGEAAAACRSLDRFFALDIAAATPWAPAAQELAVAHRCGTPPQVKP